MKASFDLVRPPFSRCQAAWLSSVMLIGALSANCSSDTLVPDRGTRPGGHLDSGHDALPISEDALPSSSDADADALETSVDDEDDGDDASTTEGSDAQGDHDAICTPGVDQTCNDDPAISSIHGQCTASATCVCSLGMGINPATGRCL